MKVCTHCGAIFSDNQHIELCPFCKEGKVESANRDEMPSEIPKEVVRKAMDFVAVCKKHGIRLNLHLWRDNGSICD